MNNSGSILNSDKMFDYTNWGPEPYCSLWVAVTHWPGQHKSIPQTKAPNVCLFFLIKPCLR